MTGTRGPLPKPYALRLLEGNPGKRSLNLADVINPKVEVPTAPKHLGRDARKEWARITPLLEELGLISGLDRAALALYCDAVGRLSEYQTAFNSKVKLLVDQGTDYADAVYKASYTTTQSGYEQQSVIRQLIKSQAEQVNRYLGHFGLSPAHRGRVQASTHVQSDSADGAPSVRTGFAQFQVVSK